MPPQIHLPKWQRKQSAWDEFPERSWVYLWRQCCHHHSPMLQSCQLQHTTKQKLLWLQQSLAFVQQQQCCSLRNRPKDPLWPFPSSAVPQRAQRGTDTVSIGFVPSARRHIEAASCRRSGFLAPSRREVVWVQFCIPWISLIFPFSGDILCVCLYIYIYYIYGGFLSYGATPKSSILDWNFPL